MNELIQTGFARLYRWLQSRPPEERFGGYDPFDGLNSWWMRSTPLGRVRLLRLVWTQLGKRSPLNLRPLLAVRPALNPQALGLFLAGYAILYRQFGRQQDKETLHWLLQQIHEAEIPGYAGPCWGYPFAWQARAFYQPAGTPLIVPTLAVFQGLLKAWEVLQDENIREKALAVSRFVRQDLQRTYEGDTFAFSYSPADRSVVYNASLMASRILAETYALTLDHRLLPDIEQSVAYCLAHQQADGSWTYGTRPYHRWIDNFHTGYNLENLHRIARATGNRNIEKPLARGLDYYLNTFFDSRGRSRYYHDRTYPVDINNPAQLLITLNQLGIAGRHRELTDRVMSWTFRHLQAGAGYFYYRKHRLFTNRINYIRWSQAWMFYALSQYLYDRQDP